MTLLPPQYLDAVVSIEIKEGEKFYPLATGFLIGLKSGQKTKEGEILFNVIFVTNNHVFKDRQEVWLRFNKGVSSVRYPVSLIENGVKLWREHPNPKIDIAAIFIQASKLQEDGIDFRFLDEDNFATKGKMKELGITEGDDVFVLGFPMGLTGISKNYVLVRKGCIARFDDEIIETDGSFLIDASIFPGNSGSPVILKPEVISIEGTQPVNRAYLIGVISSSINYRETAYNIGTNPPEPRVIFMQNSSLAKVVPIDYIYELFEELQEKGLASGKNQQIILENEVKTRN